VLAGLYLSKYDSLGLKRLGFDGFSEAFNALGFALAAKPASIKNYRDEFDPLFPNKRKGWHKRPTRDYCLQLFQTYAKLNLESFTALTRSFFELPEDELESDTQDGTGNSSFAQRLVTGLAAERYFESVHETSLNLAATRLRTQRSMVADTITDLPL